MEEPTAEGMDQPTTDRVDDGTTEGFGGLGGFKIEWILIIAVLFLIFHGGGFGGLFGEE